MCILCKEQRENYVSQISKLQQQSKEDQRIIDVLGDRYEGAYRVLTDLGYREIGQFQGKDWIITWIKE